MSILLPGGRLRRATNKIEVTPQEGNPLQFEGSGPWIAIIHENPLGAGRIQTVQAQGSVAGEPNDLVSLAHSIGYLMGSSLGQAVRNAPAAHRSTVNLAMHSILKSLRKHFIEGLQDGVRGLDGYALEERPEDDGSSPDIQGTDGQGGRVQ